MEVSSFRKDGSGTIYLTLKIETNSTDSLLQKEDDLAKLLNEAGLLATKELLQTYDKKESVIDLDSGRHYSKGVQKKKFESPYGGLEIERRVYQSSQGGKQYAVLDSSAGLIGVSTPRWAKMVSWKYTHLPSQQVEEDLRENHGRNTNRTHIQSISYDVGERLLAQASTVTYSHGIEKHLVKSISIGRDGAMLKLKEGQYREAMAGTLSLIGADREVLHTIYVGDGPEYGKANFDLRMTKEITALKAEFGQIPFTAVADGAAHNWTFLQAHVQTQIIDWWHAWQYIRAGIETIFPQEKKAKKQIEKWEKLLQENQNSILILLKLLKKNNKRFKKEQIHCDILQTAITYIENHKHQMNYALYLKKGYLIGSGVTESACKTLIKARFCGCGMQWEINNTKSMATMRGLVLTKDRWNQAWKNIEKIAA